MLMSNEHKEICITVCPVLRYNDCRDKTSPNKDDLTFFDYHPSSECKTYVIRFVGLFDYHPLSECNTDIIQYHMGFYDYHSLSECYTYII